MGEITLVLHTLVEEEKETKSIDLSGDLQSQQQPGSQRRLCMRSRLRGQEAHKGQDECVTCVMT